MKKAVLIVALATLVSACTTVRHQPIDRKAADTLKGQSFAYTERDKPSFAAMTAGSAMFAMLGAAAAISSGNSIIASNNVEDPALAISKNLGKALQDTHAITLTQAPAKVGSDDLDQMATLTAPAKYVIDVQTINWSLVYFPTDWTHYRVIYSAKARIIDTASKTVVAESFCSRVPDANGKEPTYDELVGNGAAGLKKELANHATSCSEELKTKMLTVASVS